MERFVHDENLALFRKRLADPRLTAAEREILLRLLADEEAKPVTPQAAMQDRKPD
ncbi:hypothetical protein [Bradyrhizobium sp. USDA 3256]